MIRTYSCIAILTIILIAGCSKPAHHEETGTERNNALIKTADELAKQELRRLNAIEMVYRNIPELHKFRNPATMIPESGWVKIYRQINTYTIIDVRQTDSLMYPINIDVDYQYEVFSTTLRDANISNAHEISNNDRQFNVVNSDTIHHTYLCDESGNIETDQHLILDRPTYFKEEYFTESMLPPNSAPPSSPQ